MTEAQLLYFQDVDEARGAGAREGEYRPQLHLSSQLDPAECVVSDETQ